MPDSPETRTSAGARSLRTIRAVTLPVVTEPDLTVAGGCGVEPALSAANSRPAVSTGGTSAGKPGLSTGRKQCGGNFHAR